MFCWSIKHICNLASSRGQVFKAEDSWPRGPRFKPPLWRPFFRHHLFGSKVGTKMRKTLTWHVACANPANGRVDFEEWLAYKIQLHGTEWIVSLSANWDQTKTKKTTYLQFWNQLSAIFLTSIMKKNCWQQAVFLKQYLSVQFYLVASRFTNKVETF